MAKILAIGDIHTKTWIFDKVEAIMKDYDFIVFCGDYADDWHNEGARSMTTWRLLKLLMDQNPKHVFAVIGNHDYAYIHPEIAGRSTGFNHLTYTLINTPENKKIKNWLLSLPAILEVDGITFSHAGVTNEWDGDESVYGLWNDTSPIWARPKGAFGGNITYKNIPQVIGHNTSETIWNPEPHVWCIDTFSLDRNSNPVGDGTVLEIVDGKTFNKIKL